MVVRVRLRILKFLGHKFSLSYDGSCLSLISFTSVTMSLLPLGFVWTPIPESKPRCAARCEEWTLRLYVTVVASAPFNLLLGNFGYKAV